MNANEKYEFIAHAFKTMTGHMAPGKDDPGETSMRQFQERQDAWQKWGMENSAIIRAFVGAADYLFSEEPR